METEEYIKLISETYNEVIEEYHSSDKSCFEGLLIEIVSELIESKNLTAEKIFSTVIDKYLQVVKAIAKLSPGLATSLHDEKAGITVTTYNGKMSDIPNEEEVSEETVFDASSMTKMFTALLLLKKYERGEIDLNKTFADYSPLLKNIDVKIMEALKFGVNIRTEGRVDEPGLTPEERVKRLINSQVHERNTFIYSDIPYMLVPLLFGKNIEEATENYLYEFYKMFRDELGLMQTGYSTINMTGGIIEEHEEKHIKKGIYDPKGRVFAGEIGYVSGHAGVTTTVTDLRKLFNQISNGFLSAESLELLTTTIQPHSIQLLDGNNEPVLRNGNPINVNRGMGVYINTGSLRNSDIYSGYSDRAFAACGSTGTYAIFDLENGISAVHLSNSKSGLFHKWINTASYLYGDDNDKIPKYKGATIISGTRTIKDGGIIRSDGTVMKYVRATNNFKREELRNIIKLRIAKRILSKKAMLECSGAELEEALKEIEEVFNSKVKTNQKTR